MIELLVTSNLNLTTGACTRELTVRQDGVIQSQTPLSPVEYAQLVQQAQGSPVPRQAPAPTAAASWASAGPEDFGGEDFPSSFGEVESVEAVEPPTPSAPQRPVPPPSVVRTPAQVPPPGRTMPASRPAPPAPGTGVSMPGMKAPASKAGKPANRAPRTIGALLKEGSDGDEGPNASPVEASEL